MRRDPRIYLVHMLETACLAVHSTRGVSKRAFLSHRVLRLAVERMVQIIGQAARRVPEDVRARHPEIPWRQIVGMRHRLVHDYLEVDPEAVWEVVHGDLPPLVAQLERLIPPDLLTSPN